VQLIGQPEKLSQASMTLFIQPGDRRANALNGIYSAGFLKLAVPGWAEHVSWLDESLSKLANGESEVSTIQSGKLIKAQFFKDLGMLLITVDPD
jgi:hypothetical protein